MVELMATVAILGVLVASTVVFYFISNRTATRRIADKVVLRYLNEALDEYRINGGMTRSHSLGGSNTPAKISAVVTALKTGLTFNGLRTRYIHADYNIDTTCITAAGSGRSFYFKGYTSAQ